MSPIKRSEHLPAVHRAVPKHRDKRARASEPRDVCPRCSRALDPVKYHDCGKQLQIPVDI